MTPPLPRWARPILLPLERMLQRPTALRWILLLTVLIYLPTLGQGYLLDDYFQLAWMRGEVVPLESLWQQLDLFHLVSDQLTDLYRERGILPWWAHPEVKCRFFRPLASLSHLVDAQLAPGQPGWAHLHSLGWYLGCVWAFHRLAWRVLKRPYPVMLATLIFALADSHALPVSFLANRNALMACFFILLGSDQLLRQLEEGRGGGVSTLCFLLALGSAEMGMALVALPLGLWCLRPRSSERQAWALWMGSLGVLWLLLLRLLDTGVAHNFLYLDPLASPLATAQALLTRLPLILIHVALKVPVDGLLMIRAQHHPWFALLAWGLMLSLVYFGRAVLRSTPHPRWLWPTLVLSCLPICFTPPSTRVAIVPSVWMSLLLGALLAQLAAPLLRLLHLPLAALCSAGAVWVAGALGAQQERNWGELPPELAGKEVILVNSGDILGAYVSLLPEVMGRPAPRSSTVLVPQLAGTVLTVLDEHRLELAIPAGLQAQPIQLGLMDPAHRWSLGERRQHPLFEVEVTELGPAGDPTRLEFRFEEPLSKPDRQWMRHRGLSSEPLRLPPPGESLAL